MTFTKLVAANKLYVTGKKSFELSGAKTFVTNHLSSGENFAQFNDFSANPKFEEVKKGVEIFKKGKFDCLVAVGGGSVIDMAKLIAFYAESGSDDFHTVAEEPFYVSWPVVAIPTTAGSGSEETHFAVVYDKGVKHSVAHPSLKPSYKILIPEFAFNCPQKQRVISALDAFCQSIESYWSKCATDKSKKYSLKALKLLIENLENGLINNDFNAFKKVVEASNYAGKAINVAKTTACHALSYYFTSKFKIPHGLSVSLIMPYVFEYHYKKMPDSEIMNKLIKLLGFETNDFLFEFKGYFQKLGADEDFAAYGIDPRLHVNELKQNVNHERLKNNPIKIDITKLFHL